LSDLKIALILGKNPVRPCGQGGCRLGIGKVSRPRRRAQIIGMPSHAIDEAWHGLILCTARYSAFYKSSYGQFLHHHPEGGAPDDFPPIRSTSSFAERSSRENMVAKPDEPAYFGISIAVKKILAIPQVRCMSVASPFR
jgi:hypothetical protein